MPSKSSLTAGVSRVLTSYSSFAGRENRERGEWASMTPLARLRAVEVLRQLNHRGYDPAAARVERVYSVA